MNKILVFGGFALLAILVVENMVTSTQAYLFIDNSSKTYIVVIASSIIGIGIGYGIHGFLHREKDEEEY